MEKALKSRPNVANMSKSMKRSKVTTFFVEDKRCPSFIQNRSLTYSKCFFTTSAAGLQPSSYYDSQSGKRIELSDLIKLYPIQGVDREECKVDSVLKDGKNQEKKGDYIRIQNVFSSDEVAVQGATAICGDSGYSVIMLSDSPEKLLTTDGEDFSMMLEECLWNDIDPPPMSERLGIRLAPTKCNEEEKKISYEQANIAIDLHRIKHFEYCVEDGKEGISLEEIKKILEEKNLKYKIIK